MADLIKPLNNLYDRMRRLPGVGNKSALKLAYHIVDLPESEVRELAEILLTAKREVHFCRSCFNLTDKECCNICSDPKRDHSIICVVEQPGDLLAMERSNSYHGLYHVLHGCLSPLDGIGPHDLKLSELEERVKSGTVEEVIVAVGSSVEGEATAAYIATLLSPLNVKVSRIAHGLPVGGELEYVDEMTLARALENRILFE